MGTVVGTMADLGYDIGWRVLDARYFGVPQRRRRVFIAGHLGGEPGSALHALCESCPASPEECRATWQEPAGRAEAGTSIDACYYVEDHINGTLRANGAEGNRVDRQPFVVVSTLQAQGAHHRGWRMDSESAAGNHLVVRQNGIRRLTPLECERLMSWPDNWTAPDGIAIGDGRRYAACGDGVVANVAEWIGLRIRRVEQSTR